MVGRWRDQEKMAAATPTNRRRGRRWKMKRSTPRQGRMPPPSSRFFKELRKTRVRRRRGNGGISRRQQVMTWLTTSMRSGTSISTRRAHPGPDDRTRHLPARRRLLLSGRAASPPDGARRVVADDGPRWLGDRLIFACTVKLRASSSRCGNKGLCPGP